MQKPERSSYTVLDFLQWEENKNLSLNPKFQRRSVWKSHARSYFIDTILKNMPVPPIYLRTSQDIVNMRTVREVIDGQQRLRAVLDYCSDDFRLSSSVSDEAPNKKFSQLSDAQKQQIRNYSFICESFVSIPDNEVLELFARLNTYSVKLNAQELRNGKYFGKFKRTAYKLAYEHLEFWRKNGIFTDAKIARMAEVELTSELLVAQIDGQQDKKTNLDKYYGDLDEEFPGEKTHIDRFRKTLDSISEAFSGRLEEIEFRRAPLFYTLFCVVYHRLFGLPNETKPSTGSMRRNDLETLKEAAIRLSEVILLHREGEEIPSQLNQFAISCVSQTDNLKPRNTRFETLYTASFP